MAHTLTFPSSVNVTVGIEAVTSPYTLSDGDTIIINTPEHPTFINGNQVLEDGSLYITNSDIDITVEEGSNADNFTVIINYTGAARKSVDLTTLPGWANLSSGAHSIQLKAKASGYRDSELSQAVSVTKATEGYKVTINREYLYQEGLCFYSLDDGTTWIDGYASDYAQLVLNSVDQIRFKVVNNSNNFGFARSSTLNLNISANRGDEYSDNFTLTQDITDLEFGLSAD